MTYDLLVIGGGIVGAGIARDATLRGLKVALFEKEDFGSGTTSRTTRLIHGGLRYLSKYEFGLVREALQERKTLLQIAPHLVKPLPFIMPVYKGQGHALPILWLGISIYDFMSPRRSLPHHRYLPPQDCLRLEPSLHAPGLRGGFYFFDGQCLFPERLNLENALDAAAHGAIVRNHAEVFEILRQDGRVTGVRVRDTVTGEAETFMGRLVVNATGPWLDQTERLAEPAAPPKLRRTKGVHLVVPRFTQHALIMETVDEDRVVFAIPWGDYTLIGTTDTDYEARNEDVAADADDVDYLLRELHAVLDVKLERKDILFTTAGLRPLRREVGKSTADISRSHEIRDHGEEGGPEGLVTVVGGKITTYRHVAEDVTDYALRKLGRKAEACRTHQVPLPGGRLDRPWNEFVTHVREEAAKAHVPPATAEYLARQYGSRAFEVLARVRKHAKEGDLIQSGHPEIRAEIAFAVEKEFCRSLADFLLRRTTIGLSRGQGRAVVLEVASEMAQRLGWDAVREDKEVSDYLRALDHMGVPGTPGPAPTPPAPPGPVAPVAEPPDPERTESA